MTQKALVYLMLTLCFIVPVRVAGQQEDNDQGRIRARRPPGEVRAPRDQRVYRLVNADASSTANVVRSVLGGCRVGVDERTNSLVVVATADDLAMLEKLLMELDSPVAAPPDTHTAMVRLGRNAPEDLLNLIHTLVSKGTRVAFDEGSGMLVIRGTGADVQEVERLIKALEDGQGPQGRAPTEGQALQVSFYFIQGLLGGKGALPPGTAEQADIGGKRSAVSEATWSKLEKPVTVEFEDVTFQEVIEDLGAQGDVDIVAMWGELESVGIDRDTLVSLVIRSGAPLRKVLKIVLQQVGGAETDLHLSVGEGVVTISTEVSPAADVFTKIYSVPALSVPFATPGSARPRRQEGKSDGSMPPSAASADRDRLANDLLRMIRNTVAQDSWRRHGGRAASADIAAGQLVITQSEGGHRAIAELLYKLAAERAQARLTASFIPLPPVLASVGKALAENGFLQPSMLATVTVRVQGDEYFEVVGKTDQAESTIEIEVEGGAHRASSSGMVELEVKASLARRAKMGRRPSREVVFTIDSTLVTKLGDQVVLATSPGSTDYGQAVALVMEVTAVD